MKKLKNIREINYTSDPVGRALFMAIAQLTSTSEEYQLMTPDETLANLYDKADRCGWPIDGSKPPHP